MTTFPMITHVCDASCTIWTCNVKEQEYRDRLRGEIALAKAKLKTPRNLLTIAMEETRVHKTWQGLYCIPILEKGSDAQLFIIDEANQMYKCLTCGEMWPYIIPPSTPDPDARPII